TVRQRFRQHGHHKVREVNRVAAQTGFPIKGAVDMNIMRHIGNGHVQTPAAPAALAEYGIIKVPRILAVNGDERQVTNIDAVQFVGFLHFSRNAGSLGLNRCRPDTGNAMGLDRQLNLHPGRHVITQYTYHPPHRQTILVRLLGNLYHHYLTRRGIAFGSGGNHDVLGDARVLRPHKLHAFFTEETAGQLAGVARDYLNDGTFFFATVLMACHAYQYFVAIEYPAHLAVVKVDVLSTLGGDDKAIAIPVPLHATADNINLIRAYIGIPAVADYLPIRRHGDKPPPQRPHLTVSGELQQVANFR